MGQMPLAISSDIIETLMGQFKTVIQRTPDAELNRLVLAMPTLCGPNSANQIQEDLINVTNADLKKWEASNIPETMRQFRRRTLKNDKNSEADSGPKTG